MREFAPKVAYLIREFEIYNKQFQATWVALTATANEIEEQEIINMLEMQQVIFCYLRPELKKI